MPAKKLSQGTNRLLSALPPKEVASLYRRFETVDLELHATLSKAGKPIDAVYFPEAGMISLVQTLEDGMAIEVGLIGAEGFFGVPLVLGARATSVEAIVQGTGSALRIPAKAFIAELSRNEKFRALLLRYTQALLSQVIQTAACNGRHNLHQRLARWLLEAHSRMDGQKIAISHEFLALMLGCRRSGVTVALGALRTPGVIDAGRGHITINDRKRLEPEACECYRTVQAEFRRLLP
jgi:CRP-like cAMP-binding protein